MTTEIQRIPGAFNLPSDWPRVDIVDLESDLFAHYVASTSDYDSSTGWKDRRGNADLVNLSSPTPPFQTDPVGVAFVEQDNQFADSNPLTTPYSGPITIAGVFRWSTGPDVDAASYVVSTAGDPNSFYGLRVEENNGRAVSVSSNEYTFYAPMPEATYCAVVAVFNGANSSISVNGATVRGELGPGSMEIIRLGNNSNHSAPLYGRIGEIQIHTRAFNDAEVEAVTSQLRQQWGL